MTYAHITDEATACPWSAFGRQQSLMLASINSREEYASVLFFRKNWAMGGCMASVGYLMLGTVIATAAIGVGGYLIVVRIEKAMNSNKR